ncbi:hypothetical protein QBC46DRAFT_395373 [Diplogelasinospora grovesii]|uniref:UVI-1 protein n=1 Tax=Diplogelasinospora grovesii TaxID=303347 RepID=A0AAN6S1B0_9PEZI|nr:hypothetical protein QBC46DRAFT_395373 [Diplogelasinospora grovesii]
MRFSLFNAAAAALAVCASAVSALTPAEVVTNIQVLTTKSQQLQGPANSITIVNGPLIIIGQGPFPQIIQGFSEIITLVANDIQAMGGMAPVPAGPGADAIFNAFREFVRVHQVLLNILIGKAGLFSTVPFIGQPVASILRSLESIVDTIAFGIINGVQAHTTDFVASKDSLDGTIQIAIQRYQGLGLN